MKCQILFSGKNKKKITDLTSAESAHSLMSVQMQNPVYHLCILLVDRHGNCTGLEFLYMVDYSVSS